MPYNYEDTPKLQGLRRKLVEKVRKKGIRNERVLRAMRTVPRHALVEGAFAERAYDDIPLPIGAEQTISQPYTVAYMTSKLDPKPGEKVLEIGTGSGYQAAILAELGCEVYTIERHRRLHQLAGELLAVMGYSERIHLKCADGTYGWPAHAPYDGIIVTAGGPDIPEMLPEQLKLGGKLVIPVGERDTQTMVVLTRVTGDEYEERRLHGFRFVPLIGDHGWAH